jgi:CRP/FNR family transcriptional regulator, cyclic AMP receptor protein
VTSTSDPLLEDLPLLSGLELRGPAKELVPIELEAGQELWRQGQAADGLYIVVAGRLRISARLPGGRESALAEVGPPSVVGELALLDSGTRTAGVRAIEPTRLLRLTRRDFRALVSGHDPGARAVRRRLLELACRRLAARHQALAEMLDGTRITARAARGEPAPPPDPVYLLRLSFFHQYGPDELQALLGRGSVERVAPGTVLVAEGERSPGLLVTLNGAVEEAIRRDTDAIRTALLGPGWAFGHAGLLAGRTATADAIARERSVVLVVEADQLERELTDDAFATAIEKQTVAGLRQAERPQARLTATDALAATVALPTSVSADPLGRERG